MITCDNSYIIEPALTRDETYYIIIKRKINDHPLYFKSDEKRGVVHIDSRELYFIFFFFASCMRRFVISLLGIGAVSCIVCRRESGFVRQCPLITYLTGWELRSASAAQSCVLTDVPWSTKKQNESQTIHWYPRKWWGLVQRWFKAGPASVTLARL